MTTFNVCDTHKLGIGCAEHCHIMNDCAPCYAAMEITALTVLKTTRELRRSNSHHKQLFIDECKPFID